MHIFIDIYIYLSTFSAMGCHYINGCVNNGNAISMRSESIPAALMNLVTRGQLRESLLRVLSGVNETH